jgi:hypothetical protein
MIGDIGYGCYQLCCIEYECWDSNPSYWLTFCNVRTAMLISNAVLYLQGRRWIELIENIDRPTPIMCIPNPSISYSHQLIAIIYTPEMHQNICRELVVIRRVLCHHNNGLHRCWRTPPWVTSRRVCWTTYWADDVPPLTSQGLCVEYKGVASGDPNIRI